MTDWVGPLAMHIPRIKIIFFLEFHFLTFYVFYKPLYKLRPQRRTIFFISRVHKNSKISKFTYINQIRSKQYFINHIIAF